MIIKSMTMILLALISVSSFGAFVLNDTKLDPNDAKTAPWAREHRRKMMTLGITDGTEPQGNLTREQQWAMMGRYNDVVIQLVEDSESYKNGLQRKNSSEAIAEARSIKELSSKLDAIFYDLDGRISEVDRNARYRDHDNAAEIERERNIVQDIQQKQPKECKTDGQKVVYIEPEKPGPFYAYTEYQGEDDKFSTGLLELGFGSEFQWLSYNIYYGVTYDDAVGEMKPMGGIRAAINGDRRIK